ncbi:MAG: tRNA (guanosine(46)-N7)-methyltransferase TrmB [Alphaproteobacteria bacterium]|nr:tRNA (guanosine(46)-N7)-methyltransferase TrmB [Alphaproteobacteria bacterium]
MTERQTQKKRLLYGRRHGHRLRAGQQARLERLLPELAIALPGEEGAMDPKKLFPKPPDDIWFEIGFGAGEHLAQQAASHPATGFLGCEPFVNGIAALLRAIETEDLQNIRIFPDDARALLTALPPQSLGRVFILFPDPWPKKRHHKRRFVSTETLDALARVMKEGAELRLATDDAGYLRWMLFHLLGHAAFAWEAKGPGGWRERPADWPATRYEAKATREGRKIAYLRFRRRPGKGEKPAKRG